MCLLIAMRPGMTPKEDDLMTAVVNNPDGCGWAIIHGDKIKLSREMKGSKAVVKFLADREQYPDGWALFHARIATHGTVGLDNCHPFKVGGDSRVLFAHNGILNISLSEGDLRSDSKAFAEDLLPRLPITNLDDWFHFAMLEAWLGYDKAVILTVHPDLKQTCYILNEKYGFWREGVWYSNTSYKPFVQPVKTWGLYKDVDGEWKRLDGSIPVDSEFADIESDHFAAKEEIKCSICHEEVTSYGFLHGQCEFCYTCLICEKDMEECKCGEEEYDLWCEVVDD